MNLTAILISLAAVAIALNTRRSTMDAVERLTGLVATLNETITAESAQQAAAIADLRAAIDSGASAASLNQIADDLEASIGRVKAIVPDVAAIDEPGEVSGAGTEG